MTKKIAIISAPNGAKKQQSDHPSLPVTIDEIVKDAVHCRNAGAAMIHVHARDKAGKHSLAIDENQRLLDALKSEISDSVIIQLTTEAIGLYTAEQQMELIKETSPPAASFALRELIPDTSSLTNAERFFRWVADQNMLAQYILYDSHDVERYLSLCRDGILPGNGRHALLVLGRYHKQQRAEPADILPFLHKELLANERWGVCAFGPKEYHCLTTAMLLGGDIRVGFENNHLDKNGNIAKDNASQILSLASQAKELGISIHNAGSYEATLRA